MGFVPRLGAGVFFYIINTKEYNIAMKKETKELLSPLFTILGFGIIIVAILLVTAINIIRSPHLTLDAAPTVTTNEDNYSLVGTTMPNTKVQINDQTTTSNALGRYNKNVKLNYGVNTINVSVAYTGAKTNSAETTATDFNKQTIITRNTPVSAQENPATNGQTDATSNNDNAVVNDNTTIANNNVNVTTSSKDLSASGPVDNIFGAMVFATIIISIYIYLKSKSKLSRTLIPFT